MNAIVNETSNKESPALVHGTIRDTLQH